MDFLDGGEFIAGRRYAFIEVDHFCYFCIVDDKLDPKKIPFNKYLVVAMKQRMPNSMHHTWIIHICLVPLLKTCIEVSISYTTYVSKTVLIVGSKNKCMHAMKLLAKTFCGFATILY